MTIRFLDQIRSAFADDAPEAADAIAFEVTGDGDLPSCFAVSDFAAATVGAAGAMLARLAGGGPVAVDRRLASLWFQRTLHPEGWELPPEWDAVAGVYRARDGWIRLHTNAAHHRAAALRVLNAPEDREAVAEAVATWDADALETEVVAAGGCAAVMRDAAAWAAHPQGAAVAEEPLIAWSAADGPASPAPTAPAPDVSPDAPLAGVRVLDLTRVLAGPVATRFLAAFGADVLRIDPPGWEEPGLVPDVTLGKRCAGLDLRLAADREIFGRLLASADVLAHGYRPGALDALGFDAAARRRVNPGLIDVSLCAYGWTGPWARRRGFDSLVQMSSGIAAAGMAAAGADRPTPLPVQALDHGTGYLMAAAALHGLRERARGRVLSARLSLARTGSLLSSEAPGPAEDPIRLAPADMAEAVEATPWGAGRRTRFPLRGAAAAVRWPHPAGPLRTAEPRWTGG